MSYKAIYVYSIEQGNTKCAEKGAASSIPLRANFKFSDGVKPGTGDGGVGVVGRINKVSVKQVHTWTGSPGTTDYYFKGTFFGVNITSSVTKSDQASNDNDAHSIWSEYEKSFAPLNQTPISDVTICWGNFKTSSDMYWRSVRNTNKYGDKSPNRYRIEVVIEYDVLTDVKPYNYTYTPSFNVPSGKSPIGGYHTATITCEQATSEGAGLPATGFSYIIENSSGNSLYSGQTTDSKIVVANSYLIKGSAGVLKVKITPTNTYGSGEQTAVTLSYNKLEASFPSYSNSLTPFYEDANLQNPINYNSSVSCFLATKQTNYFKINTSVTNEKYDYSFGLNYSIDGVSKTMTTAQNSKYFTITADWNKLINITTLSCSIAVVDTNGNSLGTYSTSKTYAISTLKIGTNVILSVQQDDYTNITQSGTTTVLAGKIFTVSLTGTSSEYYKCVLTATIGGENIIKTLVLSNGKAKYSFGIESSPTFPVSTIRNKTLTKISFSIQNSSGVSQYFKEGNNTPTTTWSKTYSNIKFMNNWGLNIGFAGDVTGNKFYKNGKFNFTLDQLKIGNTTSPAGLTIKANNTNITSGTNILYSNSILSGAIANQNYSIPISSNSLYGYTIGATSVAVYKLQRISLNISGAPSTMELYQKWDNNGNPVYNSVSFTASHTTSSEDIVYTLTHTYSGGYFNHSESGEGANKTITISTKSGASGGDTIKYTCSVAVSSKTTSTVIETIEKSVTIRVTNAALEPFHKKTDRAYANNYVYTKDTPYYIDNLTEVYVAGLNDCFIFQPTSFRADSTFTARLNSDEGISGEFKNINESYLASLKLAETPAIGSVIHAYSSATIKGSNKKSQVHDFCPTAKGKNLVYNSFKITSFRTDGFTEDKKSKENKIVSIPYELSYTLSNTLSNITISDFYIVLECSAYGSQTSATIAMPAVEIRKLENYTGIIKNQKLVFDFTESDEKEEFFSQNTNINFTISPKLYGPIGDSNGSVKNGVIYSYNSFVVQSILDSPDLAIRKNGVAINRNPTARMTSALEIALVQGQTNFISFYDTSSTINDGLIGAFEKSGEDILISCGSWK